MKTCTRCGASNTAHDKSCRECGAPMDEASSGDDKAMAYQGTIADTEPGGEAWPLGTIADPEEGPAARVAPRPPRVAGEKSQYEVMEEIGRGGMSVVYRARDRNLHRDVALKQILPEFSGREKAVSRLTAEARSIANLQHFHIVHVYDIGQGPEGPYIAMEYVAGKDGRPWTLRNRVEADGPLEAEEAADLVAKLCRGAAHAHTKGIIHRDIKPSNVLLTPEGEPKLADFGIARADETTVGQTFAALTVEGVSLGTVDYMSPEQEADASQVDARTDVYALGALLSYCLTGHPPRFFREGKAPAWMRSALLKAIERDREQRWATAAEFGAALTAALRQASSGAGPGTAGSGQTEAACPKCGAENPMDARYCQKCGRDLSELFRKCPSCGREIRVDVQFCGGCGHDVKKHFHIVGLREEAEALLALYDYEHALAPLQHILELDPENSQARALHRRTRESQERLTRAREAIASGSPDDADPALLDSWETVVRLQPTDKTARATAATLAEKIGDAHATQGGVGESIQAIHSWCKALVLTPDSGRAVVPKIERQAERLYESFVDRATAALDEKRLDDAMTIWREGRDALTRASADTFDQELVPPSLRDMKGPKPHEAADRKTQSLVRRIESRIEELEATINEAWRVYREADRLWFRKQYKACLALCEEVLSGYPHHDKALELREKVDTLLRFVVCPKCKDKTPVAECTSTSFCTMCGDNLSGMVRTCPDCGQAARVELPECPGCDFDLAAHFKAQELRAQAESLRDSGEAASALRRYEQYLALESGDAAAKKEAERVRELVQKREDLIQRAERLYQQRDLEKALALWRKVVELDPKDAAARSKVLALEKAIKAKKLKQLREKAEAETRSGSVKRAFRLWKQVLALDPEDTDAQKHFGELRTKLRWKRWRRRVFLLILLGLAACVAAVLELDRALWAQDLPGINAFRSFAHEVRALPFMEPLLEFVEEVKREF